MQLTSKAFATLATLVTNQGETLTKRELMDAVWGEVAVEENNLTQQISTLRRSLGERARDHRFIVTVPGKGYCFVSPVQRENVSTEEPGKAELKKPMFDPGSVFGVSLAIAYVIIVSLPLIILGGRTDMTRPQTVAVLAFKTAAATDEPLGAGIRDTLRAKLGSLEDVTVRPNSTDLDRQDVLIAGRRLNADVVLTGSIQHGDDRVRVTVEMVDVNSERIVWGKTFDQNSSNVFELQDSIAGEVIRILRRQRTLSESVGASNDDLVAEFPASRDFARAAC